MGLLEKEQIQLLDGAGLDWQQAINHAAKPLLDSGLIQQEYVDSVIAVCNDKGPYMNIGPQVVLAHARPLSTTKESCLSLLQTKSSIPLLNQDHPARLWFFLATPDNNSHLSIIQQLAAVLMDKKKLETILDAQNVEEIYGVFAN